MKLLVIEDDQVVRSLLERVFTKKGFQIDAADNAAKGFDLATGGDYTCIILDLGLPDKDGLELCQNIRNAGVNTPILILSAYKQTETKVSGLNFGADDYITKPFDNDELVARVNALIRRNQKLSDHQSTLVINELHMNLIEREFFVNGEKIPLTNNEFNLLAHLIKNKNSVVSKKEILRNVFDMENETETNFINVYISYLRKKINAHTNSDYIRTVRGKGFLFEENEE